VRGISPVTMTRARRGATSRGAQRGDAHVRGLGAQIPLTLIVVGRGLAAISIARVGPSGGRRPFVARMVSGKSFDALPGDVGGPWRSSCIWTLLVPLLAILPLAEASPPDPLWVGGMYDGADLDDVVAAVITATAVVGRTVLLLLDAAATVGDAVQLTDRASLPRPSLPARPVRAPPSFSHSVAA